MPPTRPFPSMTIPRGFRFHYEDNAPKTPEPQEIAPAAEPPQAPRQPLRRTTRRLGLPTFAPQIEMPSSTTLPTIPCDNLATIDSSAMRVEPLRDFHLLSPAVLMDRPLYPLPKTPLPQQLPDAQDQQGDYFDQRSLGESISRPSTACSLFSDSSISSRDSVDSFPSYGNCVSPATDYKDPFDASRPLPSARPLASPLEGAEGPSHRHTHVTKKTLWTDEMDNHLWATFLIYLRDPSHTPFKLFPGSNPPLGVCSRVANEAKKSWRTKRGQLERHIWNRTSSSQHTSIVSKSSVETMPIGSDSARRSIAPWPRNSSTRRRLRTLCKGNPTLSTHYQRLMQTRSPSPFDSSSSSSRVRSSTVSVYHRANRPTFSTRDMNISLMTTTSEAMRSGNPLSQLASDSGSRDTLDAMVIDSASARAGAHQRSHSLQLGIEASGSVNHPYGLASPFQPRTQWSARQPQQQSKPASNAINTMQSSRKLDPPLELHDPAPMSRSLKRRARMHLDDGSGESRETLLQEVFGAPAESSHRRVRTRGFSLGDMHGGARYLSSIFTPPSEDIPPPPGPGAAARMALRSPPNAHGLPSATEAAMPPRLGSPFAHASDNQHFNTFPRNFKIQPSPTTIGEAPASPAMDRLGAVAPGRIAKTPISKSLGRNFARNNPTISRLLREHENS